MKSIVLANSRSPWIDSANGVTMPVRMTAAGVDPDVNSLFRVPLSIRLFPASMTFFEWRNVSLTGTPATPAAAPAPATAAGGPAGLVADVDGYRFTALRCNALPASTPKLNDTIYAGGMDFIGNVHLDPTHPLIECFFRVENSRANREILLDGVTFIGNDGNTYDGHSSYVKPLIRLGWLGEEEDYRKSATIPYHRSNNDKMISYSVAPPDGNPWTFRDKYFMNGPTLAAGTPEYFWAVFVGPPASVNEAAQIRLSMRTSRANGAAGYSQISAVFRGIPIVPFSKSALTAIAAKTEPKPTPASVTPEIALARYWSLFLVKCSGTTYSIGIHDPYGSLGAPRKDPLYTERQYRNPSPTPARRFPISEIDKMNGLEWKVSNFLQASAFRDRTQNDDHSWGPWSEWRTFLPMENPVVIVQKKNGRVTYLLVKEVPYEELEEHSPGEPTCADLQK